MSKRLNNFEALRILAMFMVVVLHYLSKGNLLTPITEPFTAVSYLGWLIEAFAIVAVNVYVLITGYFMCESRMKLGRLLQIVCQVLWYTMLVPVVLCACGMMKPSELGVYELLQCIFPIHTKHYWFVTSYVLLMLMVPFLNAGIRYMSQKQLALATALLVLYQTMPKSILPLKFSDDAAGYDMVWLVCLYLIAAYIRKYGLPFFSSLKKSLLCYVVSVLAIWSSLLLLRVIYIKWDVFGTSVNFAYNYNHLFCLAASVSLFYACKHWQLPDGKISCFVGKVAPYTFGVYLLHEHILVRNRWTEWLQTAPTQQIPVFLAELLGKTLLVLAVGMLLDWLRALVFQAFSKLRLVLTVQKRIKRIDNML